MGWTWVRLVHSTVYFASCCRQWKNFLAMNRELGHLDNGVTRFVEWESKTMIKNVMKSGKSTVYFSSCCWRMKILLAMNRELGHLDNGVTRFIEWESKIMIKNAKLMMKRVKLWMKLMIKSGKSWQRMSACLHIKMSIESHLSENNIPWFLPAHHEWKKTLPWMNEWNTPTRGHTFLQIVCPQWKLYNSKIHFENSKNSHSH